jgi:two-component system phosphate regulon sensor histidine kinase PhoR
VRGSFISLKNLVISLLFILIIFAALFLILLFTAGETPGVPSILLPVLLTSILAAVGLLALYLIVQKRAKELQQALFSIRDEDWQRYESLTLALRKIGWFDHLDKIADLIKSKSETILRQQSERLALLSSMVEGVLAVDNQERVLIVNQAAGEIFDVSGDKAVGKVLPEVIRSMAVQRIIAQVLATGKAMEGEIAVLGEDERKLLAHGSPLRDTSGKQIGVIVVFNDITKLEKYERIRRDFVANVSHELKTPITTIKGFVETLRSRTPVNPKDNAHFLEIIAGETDRMNAIVNDLLALTSVEHDDESGETELILQSLQPVAEAAMATLETKAREHGITLELSSPPEVSAPINVPLLEQAIINLLDNAINYSKPGKTIWVEITTDAQNARIAVRDQGIGIDKRYIPRLTERFFRVDKSRSRKQGGTGLGLAIVKHIAKVHHGELCIESEPGTGSTFTIILPTSASNFSTK